MEINLENAFLIALQISISPFMSSVDVAAQKVHGFCQRQAINILEKPLLSTLIISCILLPLISVVTISITITAGVLCVLVVILIIEGFILAMIIALAAAITASCFSVIVIMTGIVSAYKTRD